LVGIMQRRIEDFALIGSALRLEGFIRRKLEMGSGTNPYTLCATWAMIDVIDKASAKWMGERVALTFAEKAKTSKSLMDAYATAKASHENGRLLISITRARPKDVSPLQAADLFAYEANKHVNGQHDRPPRWPVAQMKPLFVGGALFDYHKLSLVMA
ncbi:MAG TPA: hypothetical protein VGR96_19045, partial [Acidobacteriaceae bacterium]|nr:hypothetical protein [Acidobacteriaceae bacterium]